MGLINDATGAVGGAFEHVSGSLGCGVKFDTSSIPSQSGKVILITGGNIGLGRETCRVLAAHQPRRIYLCARSAEKAEATIKELKEVQPDAPLNFLPLDLADLESVQACARAFVEKEDRLDLLFCNAGIMAVPEGLTKDGYEVQFGTNHLGHALLVKLLLPTLQRTVEKPGSDVRVVTVSSVGHHLAPEEGVEFAALKGEMRHLTTWNRYAQSKLANRLFANQLAERYPGIMSVSVHPGVVTTNLYSAYVGDMGLKKLGYWGFKQLLSVSVEEGSKNQLWAATSPREKLVPGEYYFPVGILGKGSRQGEDKELGKRLWEWTEKELEAYTL
ncbi:hypothetical protein V494_02648 [Pseudogymnoascus sp. VKM F-4513 (FW-928)]|nr:hypothetical protein V494_02648 [Pseudogymnoascus sp. VKM F-4513 (FW-928)]